MAEAGIEQIRNFRLRSHHLDNWYKKKDILCIAGACGLPNSPPGAWENALFFRVPDCRISDLEYFLYEKRSLLQAWSFRGAPVIFPLQDSDVFLSALKPDDEEPWIYTNGISLALDFLQMSFEELLKLLQQVMPRLNECVIESKTTLDQTVADWMLPMLPASKQGLWNQPSMYGSPDKQTVGGAVVSFLLRPCALDGLVVFGRRNGITPSFTSCRNWTGHDLKEEMDAGKRLVRKFLHCYGPATAGELVNWLGCSGRQGKRLWASLSDEMYQVTVAGKKNWILSADRENLFSPVSFDREMVLLGGHDPYLDQRDRQVLQPDRSLHKQIWRTVSNRGVVLYRGEVIGIWTGKQEGHGMAVRMTMWKDNYEKQKLRQLVEEYAAFRQRKLMKLEFNY